MPKPITKEALAKKLGEATRDRLLAQSWLNDVIWHARLGSPKIGQLSGTATDVDSSSIEDLFDTTLSETVDDFGSDMNNLFCPRHEQWVSFEPSGDLSQAQKQELQDPLRVFSDSFFAKIEQSNFYSAAPHAWKDLAVSAMALAIMPTPSGGIDCQHIELSCLLLTRGPNNTLDGRFREWPPMKRQDLGDVFPQLLGKKKPGTTPEEVVKVVDGWVQDRSDPTIEAWHYVIQVNGEIEHQQYFTGAGSCGFIVCRWAPSTRTAWLHGPAWRALPPARTLDELSYLYLKALNRDVDPVVSYESDGVMNPENGVDAGTWLPRMTGSQKPEVIESKARLDASVFERAKLEGKIRKTLYQDRPDQTGKTPPTATQWMDEKAWNTRRLELPREQITAEWVMPVINRFAWIFASTGAVEMELVVDKGKVKVAPVSPLTKARDLEDMSTTMQVANMGAQFSQMEAQGSPIDALQTMQNIKATAKERHIVFKSPEAFAQEQAARAGIQQMPPEGMQ
jgi:hypothetical protein